MAVSICIEAKSFLFRGGLFRIAPMPSIYHPPVKRSMTIAGHETSISLEPLFWDALRAAAGEQDLPVNALVARIDVERLESDMPCGLASAIRLWLLVNSAICGHTTSP
jgi:predicted DNA-binding ribbon-helix-helix protein